MTFADLSAGQSVFLDANGLIYHFQPHPAFGNPCTNLLNPARSRPEIKLRQHTYGSALLFQMSLPQFRMQEQERRRSVSESNINLLREIEDAE